MDKATRAMVQDLILAMRAAMGNPNWGVDACPCWFHGDRGAREPAWYKEAFLGRGCFSMVLEHPSDPNKVIKMFLNGEDGTTEYIKAVANGEFYHPNAPVVDWFGTVLGVQCAVMEKLEEQDAKAEDWLESSECQSFMDDLLECLGISCNDLHFGNVMFRPCGWAVVTDPSC